MLTKLMSAFISALLFSLTFTLISEQGKDLTRVLYYTATHKFLTGFGILLLIYICIGIPASYIVEWAIYRDRRPLISLLLYFVMGSIIGMAFLIINPSNHPTSAMELILIFGFASVVFYLCQCLIGGLARKLHKQRN
ncbi:hypothetical protein M3201_13450 [Paenibacillus motobuensis]|uniref:hypothetical protein n=1 Tax=Paenibacillus TaxID=44249 RepID=UPI00203CA362|nr:MULTISPECIES: hypothetical protein [Paenibacillus]MCM3040703.1 hypothetical protein [Paenibacillus lutimineralis]MCM3647807.1 hypothetical protein [Paenibacillus motobuensis]